MSEHSQPPTLIVGQSDATTAQLRLQRPVLFAQEADDVALVSLDPSKEHHEQEVEWEHASESIGIGVGAVFGHYELGHASISTTLNIYTHVVDASHRIAVEEVEERLFGELDPNGPKSAAQPETGRPQVVVLLKIVIGGAARI